MGLFESAKESERNLQKKGFSNIPLPKGCGVICGIGKRVAANSVTSTHSIIVAPITSGRVGSGHQLSLSCGIGSIVGNDWSLSLAQITIELKRSPDLISITGIRPVQALLLCRLIRNNLWDEKSLLFYAADLE